MPSGRMNRLYATRMAAEMAKIVAMGDRMSGFGAVTAGHGAQVPGERALLARENKRQAFSLRRELCGGLRAFFDVRFLSQVKASQFEAPHAPHTG